MTYSKSRRPIILLAFANDDGRSLHQLDEEQRELKRILEPVRKEGKCEVLILPAATAEDVVEIFLKYQQRIRVFHYGGHSDTDAIFFKNADQTQWGIKAENLAQFLALQQRLELIFLNSCLSLPQARTYQEAGAKIVLATSKKIGDQAARQFASLFYKALVGGADILEAYELAKSGLKVDAASDLSRGIGLKKKKSKSSWQLFPKRPTSPWRLPLIARELTRIPTIDLEEEFLGRKADIKRLKDKLENTSKVVLMNGLGGIGKTVLATAYVQQYGNAYDHLAWINRGEDLIKSVALNEDLAERLGLPFEQEEEFEARFGRILRKLHQLPGQNLLVIDNAQEQVAQKEIYQTLPGLPNWRVLLTSRLNLSGFDRLPLDTLQPDATRKLFRTYYKGACTKEELEALLQEIGYHTLTVELLAKLLAKLNNILSVSDLTQILKERQLGDTDLQEKIWARYNGEERGIFLHLMKAFELSNLDEQEKWLLRQFIVLPVEQYPVGKLADLLQEKSLRLNKTLNDLAAKGWLTLHGDKTFSIHRLIRQVAEYQSQPEFSDVEVLIECLIEKMNVDAYTSRIAATFPWISYATTVENYFTTKEHERLAKLQNYIALTYSDLGQFEQALGYHQKAQVIWESVLETNDPYLATSYNNIAATYRDLGQYEQALGYHQKAQAIWELVLEANHPYLASSYNNIALTYSALGQYEQALGYHQKAQAIWEPVLETNHPNLASSYNNIGLTYSDLGQHEEALDYHQKAQAIFESVLEANHPELATSYNNIALTFNDLGQYEQALGYLQKAQVIWESVLEANHPSLATSYNNIALTYSDLGQYEQALGYYQNAIAIFESVLEANHPSLATSYDNIALTYRGLGQNEKAEEYEAKAAAIQKKKNE